ncbi:MAG: fasciclin domain-containing protein [Lewinellaceae bacterium]|nr:fasciclin domain-containing protein [Saprospiraceae bacterium]MCB0542073.1 fasciclin domain-containing protein [Saprospiraceae bacterium]MCB9307466.1 fasciclin domain-containing protein [Lewinellaceae bacterium]MCB9355308.1 fasciclin domain-containing protein [Lewinellaceae bacterium]
MKKLLFSLLLLAGTAFFFTACKDTDHGAPKNIVELAQSNADLSTLVSAVQRAGLVDALSGDDMLTVFAPTNQAFSDLLSALGFSKLEDVPVADLKNILLHHVVSGEVKSTDLSTGYVPSLLPYGNTDSYVSIYVDLSSGVKVNGSTVTTPDLSASNGVVHVINKVIVPPTVVNHALNNPNFSILVTALTRSDLSVDYVSTLSGDGPFTVFAPTNDAFADLLTELGANSLDDIPAATLDAVLQYHVVAGANVLASQLSDEQVVTTFQGGTFKVDLSSGAQIIDAQNRTANIILTDVQGTNGVVHAIDKVILP